MRYWTVDLKQRLECVIGVNPVCGILTLSTREYTMFLLGIIV